MSRNRLRTILALGAIVTVGAAAGCGDVSHNDFDQTLSFDGFFADADGTCGTGLAVAAVSTAQLVDANGVPENCSAGTTCAISLQVTNLTTGIPIPSNGGQGSTGQPVPTTEGVTILGKRLHLAYTLPIGELPSRDYNITDRIDPAGTECRGFPLLEPRDTVAMIQDPLSFPQTPFYMTARVTYEGVTDGGLDIRTHGDIDIQVF